jgi:hypothetical protein
VRLTAVHVPRTFRTSSSSPARVGVTPARQAPPGLYVLAGAQILSSGLLVVASASGFESSLGDSQAESLGMLIAIVGFVLAAGLLLTTRWARPATLVWLCALLVLQLVLYARDDSPNFLVMALCLVQVVYLNQPDVKRALAGRLHTRRDV